MDPVTGIILVIGIVLSAVGIVSVSSTAREIDRRRRAGELPKEPLPPGRASALFAEAQSSQNALRIEDIADELQQGDEPYFATRCRSALNRYYSALSSTTEEARTHYWEIVGAGFVGLANQVALQRPSVLQ